MHPFTPLFLLTAAVLGAAEPAATPPAASPLDGLAEIAKQSEEAKQASLDGGSTIGFIPVSSTTAAKTLGLYLVGFFHDPDSKGPVVVPKKAQQVVNALPQLKAAGATHLLAMSHEGAGDVEYVRFLAIGNFTTAALAKLEAAGLGKRGEDGSFHLVAFKDSEEIAADEKLPPLPIARLKQMAQQLAAETDCAVDIIPLAAKDAVASYEEAIKEAFVEEGQALDKAEVPARAKQLTSNFALLKAQGGVHVIVTAFQNMKGKDIVLVVAKGTFSPEFQAKAKTTLGVRIANETTILLGHWTDGEERGEAAAVPTAPAVKMERPGLERRMERAKK